MFFLWLPPCKKIGVRILADSNNINLRESRVYVRAQKGEINSLSAAVASGCLPLFAEQ